MSAHEAALREALEQALATLTDERLSQWRYLEGDEMHVDFQVTADKLHRALASTATAAPETQTARNAARYEWLREQIKDKGAMVRAQALFWTHSSRRELDAAIDEAIAEKEQP